MVSMMLKPRLKHMNQADTPSNNRDFFNRNSVFERNDKARKKPLSYKPPLLNRNLEMLKKRRKENESRSRRQKRRNMGSKPKNQNRMISIDKEGNRADNLRQLAVINKEQENNNRVLREVKNDVFKSNKKNEKYRIKKIDSNQYLNSYKKVRSNAEMKTPRKMKPSSKIGELTIEVNEVELVISGKKAPEYSDKKEVKAFDISSIKRNPPKVSKLKKKADQ